MRVNCVKADESLFGTLKELTLCSRSGGWVIFIRQEVRVAQIGILLTAVGLFLGGLLPLMGYEISKKKTQPAVSVLMMILAIGLLYFGFVVLPEILRRP